MRTRPLFICCSTIGFASVVESFFVLITTGANRIALRERLGKCRWAVSREPDGASVISEKRKIFVATPTARSIAASVFFKQKGNEEFVLARLDADAAFQSLDQRDKAFARLLVTTVERRLGQIDKVLEVCSDLERKKHKGVVYKLIEACLRIGAVQLLFLDVAPHAAVKETVEVLRGNPLAHVPEPKIKFVNAVLRRIAREGLQLFNDHTSVSDNVAPWLYREWEKAWGEDWARQICLNFMTEAPIFLSVNIVHDRSFDERLNRRNQLQQLLGEDSVVLPHGSIQVGDSAKGPISEWPLYMNGGWWVQDASAAIPALALLNVIQSEARSTATDIATMHVVDLCAAPGGKTAQLLSFGFGKVTAVEISERRSKKLQENLARLGLENRCNIVVQDGSLWKPDHNDTVVTGVLVDVPCSATGTASRRPDVLRRNEDLGNLLETQQQLALNAANEILGVGGILVYATCSLLKQESEEQMQKLLRCESGAVLETVPFVAGEIPGFDGAIDENGWMRVIPGSMRFQCDGFFVARLRRVR